MTEPRREPTALLNEIVAKDPATALYLPLAEQLREEGRVDEAIRLCEERRGRPGAGVGDRVVLGRCYLAAGRLPEARREFEQALGLDRENVAALKAVAGILAHEGDHVHAADLYRAVCRIDPGDLESQTALHQISSGDYPEVRSPDVVIGQGELTWEPVRLPREEEHLSELSLGLRTIEAFEADSPKESTSSVQDFREMSMEALERAPVAPGPGPAVTAPAATAPAPSEAAGTSGEAAGSSPVPESPLGGEPPPEARALVERLRTEMARAKKAPVEKSMDQNRGAFEQWLKRIDRGADR